MVLNMFACKLIIMITLTAFIFGCKSTSKEGNEFGSKSDIQMVFDNIYLSDDSFKVLFTELSSDNQQSGYQNAYLLQDKYPLKFRFCEENLLYKNYSGLKAIAISSAFLHRDEKRGERWSSISPAYNVLNIELERQEGLAQNEYHKDFYFLKTGEIVVVCRGKNWEKVDGTIAHKSIRTQTSLNREEKRGGIKDEGDAELGTVYYKWREFLVEGSSYIILDDSPSSYRVLDSSSEAHRTSATKVRWIRDIASQFPDDSVAVAEKLLELNVTHDKLEDRFTITSKKKDDIKGVFSIRIIVERNQAPLFHAISEYRNSSWLFVNSYNIYSSGNKWNSGELDYVRETVYRGIREYSSTKLSQHTYNALKSASESASSSIRFFGDHYYSDHEMTSMQKKQLSSLVDLVRLMGFK